MALEERQSRSSVQIYKNVNKQGIDAISATLEEWQSRSSVQIYKNVNKQGIDAISATLEKRQSRSSSKNNIKFQAAASHGGGLMVYVTFGL